MCCLIIAFPPFGLFDLFSCESFFDKWPSQIYCSNVAKISASL